MHQRNFDLIAFDWDGTLFDSTQIIVRCIQSAVNDLGGTVPTDKAAGYVIGLGLMEALAHAAPDVPREKYPLLGERYRHHYDQFFLPARWIYCPASKSAVTSSLWLPESRGAVLTTHCGTLSSGACSTVHGLLTRPLASPIRACSTN